MISANKDVGFGRTASQEEMVVGSSPELCPVVLFTPTLAAGDVVVVRGVQPMITLGGYGRNARLTGYVEPRLSPWIKRTVLFMDALELDGYDASSLPDLLPGNLRRELVKAYGAFSVTDVETARFEPVVTGLWGCRSFGGNKYIKSILQWLAASLAKTPIRLLCPEDPPFGEELRAFAKVVEDNKWTVKMVFEALERLEPREDSAAKIFDVLARSLDGGVLS